jgi:hypothetical protein
MTWVRRMWNRLFSHPPSPTPPLPEPSLLERPAQDDDQRYHEFTDRFTSLRLRVQAADRELTRLSRLPRPPNEWESSERSQHQ